MADQHDWDSERLLELLAPKSAKQLMPGVHATRSEPYKRDHDGRTVHVIPTGVSSPLANPDDPAYQVFLDLFLENGRGNSSIPDSYVDLLILATPAHTVVAYRNNNWMASFRRSNPKRLMNSTS